MDLTGCRMDFLLSLADRLLETPLVERIRIEAIEGRTCLALKDGSLVSLIWIDGCQRMPGPAGTGRDAEALRVALSPFLSRPGHALQLCFSRDPETAGHAIRCLAGRQQSRADRLGLTVHGLLEERCRKLEAMFCAETCIAVVHSCAGGAHDGEQARKEGAGNSLHARHTALTEALRRCLLARDIAAEILEAEDAAREIRASLHPFTAPWKDEWSPVPGGPARPARSSPGPAPAAVDDLPGMDWLLATEDARLVDQRIVRIGDALIAGFDVTVAPEILKPFDELVQAVADVSRALPWRCSFLLESGGLQSVRLKEQASRLLAFAAPVANGRIRESIAWLREIDGSEDTVVRLKITFATWAQAGREEVLRRNAAILKRAAEQWGNLSVDSVSADPVATCLSSVPALAPDFTAPAAAAPLSAALAMLPLGRQASPWREGVVMFRTDDGKPWSYMSGSSRQNSWVEIFAGTSGSGKSVALNAMNLASVLAPPAGDLAAASLPRIAILDIGYSSRGLIELLKDALPPERHHEVAHLKLKMSSESAVNPFDTPPGMRVPPPSSREFLVNMLSVLTGADDAGGHCPLAGLSGAVIDRVYRQLSDEEHPRRYMRGEAPAVDARLAEIGFEAGDYPTWWEVADALFTNGRPPEAALAQSRASPVLADLVEASHAGNIVSLYRDALAGETGEPVLQVLRRSISEAIRDYPLLSGSTRFDAGHARIVALDLDEVVSSQSGAASQRQVSLMFMLARHLLTRGWTGDADVAVRAVEDGTLPSPYLEFHLDHARKARQSARLFCMDEFHRCGKLPGFRRQILQDIREGRKHNIRTALSSQSLDDFGNDILEAASTVFIFDAPTDRSVGRLADLFGLGEHEQSVIRDQLTGPGPQGTPFFAIIRHKQGRCRQKLNLTIGAAELWALSTTPEDVALREQLQARTSAAEALLLLATRFPGGSAKAEIESAVARKSNSGTAEPGSGQDRDPATLLAEQLSAGYHDRIRQAAGQFGPVPPPSGCHAPAWGPQHRHDVPCRCQPAADVGSIQPILRSGRR